MIRLFGTSFHNNSKLPWRSLLFPKENLHSKTCINMLFMLVWPRIGWGWRDKLYALTKLHAIYSLVNLERGLQQHPNRKCSFLKPSFILSCPPTLQVNWKLIDVGQLLVPIFWSKESQYEICLIKNSLNQIEIHCIITRGIKESKPSRTKKNPRPIIIFYPNKNYFQKANRIC